MLLLLPKLGLLVQTVDCAPTVEYPGGVTINRRPPHHSLVCFDSDRPYERCVRLSTPSPHVPSNVATTQACRTT